MELLPTDEIVVQHDKRIRKQFDETFIEELAASIYQSELLNPLVVRDGKESVILVAGENRLRAIRLLHECGLTFRHDGAEVPLGKVPVTFITNIDDAAAYEAELEENIRRRDLTWQEKTTAIALLHKLRKEQHGDSWRKTDTAEEFAIIHKGRPATQRDVTEASTAIVIAEHMDDPFVAAAKNEKEALKLIREKKKHEEIAARRAELEEVESSHDLRLGDMREILPTLPPSTFDILLTDPPYGIDIHKKGTFDTDEHEYDDSREAFEELIQFLAEEASRLCKPQAHAYVFCDINHWGYVQIAFMTCGWDVWPRPLIWAKGNTGAYPNADFGPRYTYEAIMYAYRGGKKVTGLYTDVLSIPQPTKTDHPAHKPVDLLHNLLIRSAYPGDKVLDPFCGSGNIFPAASRAECFATGIELNEKYYNLALLKKTGKAE